MKRVYLNGFQYKNVSTMLKIILKDKIDWDRSYWKFFASPLLLDVWKLCTQKDHKLITENKHSKVVHIWTFSDINMSVNL